MINFVNFISEIQKCIKYTSTHTIKIQLLLKKCCRICNTRPMMLSKYIVERVRNFANVKYRVRS